MRVARYQAHHVLGIKDVDLNLEGHHLFLVGGDNEQGKTSAIKSLLMALCGRSGMDFPDVALRDGETEGWVKVTLTPDEGESRGLSIELYLKRSRSGQVIEKFRVIDSDGSPAKEPRSLLQRLYSLRAFDPLAFEKLDKKAKRDLLCKVLGLDFKEQEKERKRLYDERTAVNRDGVKLKAKYDGMPLHKDVPAEEVKVADLLAERTRRENHNLANGKERTKLTQFDCDVADREEEIRSADKRIADLEAQLVVLRKERENLEDQKNNAILVRDAHKLTVDSLEDWDVAAVDEQIAHAEEINRKIRENQAAAELEVELNELRIRSQDLSDAIHGIDAARQKTLEEAKWPIEGLGIDDEGVTYNGLPFEQAPKSRRILTSTLIGMALNPKLRLLVCEDGNDLGKQAIKDLEALLKDRGYQMLLEVVTRSPEDEARCSVVIEGGEVKS